MTVAATSWALAFLFVLVPVDQACCLAQTGLNSSTSTHQGAPSSPLVRMTDFLQRLADARVFSGTIALQMGGSIIFNRGYGYAMEVLPIAEMVLCCE